ncbi:MAG: BA14K family protein [Rhizobiales bacterium]|nr:BA14K family protein [Hyphomicrobiales bacterium]
MKPTIFAALVGAAAFLYPVAGAQAAPVTPLPLAEAGSPYLDLASHEGRRHMRSDWQRHRDGRRCSHRNNHCRHYRGGYWYETPWWTLPLVGGAIIHESMRHDRAYGRRHVEWCLDRYRSYDVRTNTWVAYSGDVRECISPYS